MAETTSIWMNGELIPAERAQVSVRTHALHYGTGVFEGIRAYQGSLGLAIFRLGEHIERLSRSAKAYGIPMPISNQQWMEACREVLRANGFDAAYLRPLACFGSGAGLTINPVGAEVHAVVICTDLSAFTGDAVKNGITACVSPWRRMSSDQLFPSAKGSGGYLGSFLAKREANANGFDEALMMNPAGEVCEATAENIFVVKDGKVITPPISCGILDGITRASVMTLLEEDGVPISERPLTIGDVYGADEVFLTGTAAEVTPLCAVDHRPVGEGKPGPLTRRAQELFWGAARGRLERYHRWLDPV
jgi:branched-chain amino acid aminotransferase